MQSLEFFYVESEMDYRRQQMTRPGMTVPRIPRRVRRHRLRRRADRAEQRAGELVT